MVNFSDIYEQVGRYWHLKNGCYFMCNNHLQKLNVLDLYYLRFEASIPDFY